MKKGVILRIIYSILIIIIFSAIWTGFVNSQIINHLPGSIFSIDERKEIVLDYNKTMSETHSFYRNLSGVFLGFIVYSSGLLASALSVFASYDGKQTLKRILKANSIFLLLFLLSIVLTGIQMITPLSMCEGCPFFNILYSFLLFLVPLNILIHVFKREDNGLIRR